MSVGTSGPRIGSLFSGYGGLDIAVQDLFGGSVAWVADIEEGPRRVLEVRLPECAAKDGEVGVFLKKWPTGDGAVLRMDDGTVVSAYREELTYVGSEEVAL